MTAGTNAGRQFSWRKPGSNWPFWFL